MTTKERLHQLVDELSEVEAAEALRVIAERHAEPIEVESQSAIALDDEEARRFLNALDAPESFEPGLRRLVERPSVLGE
jgi:uncharacterized protein (DUF1778 family)